MSARGAEESAANEHEIEHEIEHDSPLLASTGRDTHAVVTVA
ncbi:hypothetical protein [Streptomyces sp. NBC_01506]